MGWLIFFGILFLIAIIPVGIRIRFDEDGFRAGVILGLIRITLFPFPKWLKKLTQKKPKPKPEQPKQEKSKEEKTPEQPKSKEEKPAEPAPKKGGSLLDFLPLVKLGLNFLGDFRRKLRLNHLELKLILGGDDPCDLAVNYGRAWAALANLINALERAFVIKKRELEVECDFTSDETRVIANLEISITIGRITGLIAVYAVRALKTFLRIRKKRKGGAAT